MNLMDDLYRSAGDSQTGWNASDHLYLKKFATEAGLKMVERSPTMKLEVKAIIAQKLDEDVKKEKILKVCANQFRSYYFPQVKTLPYNWYRALDALEAQVGPDAFNAYVKRLGLVDASRLVHDVQQKMHDEGTLFGEMDTTTGRHKVNPVDLKTIGFNEQEISLAEAFGQQAPGKLVEGASSFGKAQCYHDALAV